MYKGNTNFQSAGQPHHELPSDQKIRYTCNKYPLQLTLSRITCWMVSSERPCDFSMLAMYLPERLLREFSQTIQSDQRIYLSFTLVNGHPSFTIAPQEHYGIIRAYLYKILRGLLSGHFDILIRTFTGGLQCWKSFKEYEDYREYKKYSLYLRKADANDTFYLIVAYDGISRIHRRNVAELIKTYPQLSHAIKRVVYNGRIYPFDGLPPEAYRLDARAFPLLNRHIISATGIKVPFIRNVQKHKEFFDEIRCFTTNYLSNNQLTENHILLKPPLTLLPEQSNRITHYTVSLIMGNNQLADIIPKGFQKYGPWSVPSCRSIGLFYIYDSRNQNVREKLHNVLFPSHKHENFSLEYFVKLPVHYQKSMDILFDLSNENFFDRLDSFVKSLSLDPHTAYYAIFLNPWSEFESDPSRWNIYHRVKEILMKRGIMVQNMQCRKILQSNGLRYFLPNLAVAMVTKLGGIPWKLNVTPDNELIIGFGYKHSHRSGEKWYGTTFCFRNDGTFEFFDCFHAQDEWHLSGLVAEAIDQYKQNKGPCQRIVVHTQQKPGKKIIEPIKTELKHLRMDIPVVVVSINKTPSEMLAVLPENNPWELPLNGQYFRTGNHEYLLYINERQKIGGIPGHMPMPLKIYLWCNQKEYLNDPDIVRGLMQQVYNFCFLNWRSVKAARYPVTVRYPEMLAAILPWFTFPVNPDGLKNRLWFV